MLRNPPSLFGGWDSDRPRAVAATFKGITGIGGNTGNAIPGVGGNPGLVGSRQRLATNAARGFFGLSLAAGSDSRIELVDVPY